MGYRSHDPTSSPVSVNPYKLFHLNSAHRAPVRFLTERRTWKRSSGKLAASRPLSRSAHLGTHVRESHPTLPPMTHPHHLRTQERGKRMANPTNGHPFPLPPPSQRPQFNDHDSLHLQFLCFHISDTTSQFLTPEVTYSNHELNNTAPSRKRLREAASSIIFP